MKKTTSLLFFLFIFSLQNSFAQGEEKSFWKKADSLNTKRRNAVYITEASVVAITFVGINELWYKDYPRSSFHFINDNKDWLQVDKIGHTMSAYYIGKLSMEALDWAGASKKEQLIYGAPVGFVFLTSMEILDGFSQQWGFSTGDIIANAAGTGLLIGQELLWDEQRITLKYSFHQTKYANYKPSILGENLLEQTLKDYNGQTYWLSANLWSFNKESQFLPKWLNVAIGYGAEGMLGGRQTSSDTFERYRQFYLSLDADLTKIKTKSKFLNSVFSVVNVIKIPAPAVEFTSKGNVKFHAIYF